jgi:hypothetical protein
VLPPCSMEIMAQGVRRRTVSTTTEAPHIAAIQSYAHTVLPSNTALELKLDSRAALIQGPLDTIMDEACKGQLLERWCLEGGDQVQRGCLQHVTILSTMSHGSLSQCPRHNVIRSELAWARAWLAPVTL